MALCGQCCRPATSALNLTCSVLYAHLARPRPLCLSLPQASNPLVMVQAYRLLSEEMYTRGWDYPLHLGVTEAGQCAGDGAALLPLPGEVECMQPHHTPCLALLREILGQDPPVVQPAGSCSG